MLFAEELPLSPIVPAQAVTIVIVLVTISFLLSLFMMGLALFMMSKRNPSMDATFATKKELAEVKKELADALIATKKELAEVMARADADFKRMDQRNETIAQQMFTKLDVMNNSINHEISSMNRAIGNLEGSKQLAKEIAEAIKAK